MPNKNTLQIFELLYSSHASRQMSAREVGILAKSASAHNAKIGITGMLVFDGVRFCQHLEGEPDRIREMFDKILRDPRHEDIRVLVSGASAARKFQKFNMGYATLGDVALLQELVLLEGDRAMRAFAGLVPLVLIE